MKFWVTVTDSQTCEVCRGLHGAQCSRAIRPPHPACESASGCRCVMEERAYAAKIGEPRLYDGPGVWTLYPGETACAVVSKKAVDEASARGDTKITVDQWTVEPTPGFVAWLLRLRYRVFGQWGKR